MITINEISSIELNITQLCNARCPMCKRFIDQGTKLSPHIINKSISNKIIEYMFLEQLPNLQLIDMSGTDGDPLSHPNLFDIIKKIRQYSDCTINIETNGGARSPNFYKQLAYIPNLKIIFSIDGLRDTNHLYRIGVSYDKVINNAKSFIDNNGLAIWKMIVFKHNQHQIMQAKNIAKELGFQNFKLIYNDNKINIHSKVKFPNYDITPIYEDIAQPKIRKCKLAVGKKIYVTEQGIVFPCCYFHNDFVINNSELLNFVSKNGNLNNIILSENNTLSKILQSNFFINLFSSWEQHTPITRCRTTCEIPKINKEKEVNLE